MPNESSQGAAARAEELARVAYGRLLAILAASDGDIESAEDCLAEAFAQALRTWPEAGIPDNPAAWLLTAARNRRHDLRRSAAYRLSDRLDDVVHGKARGAAMSVMQELDPDEIPDRRLDLLFVCAHPAIDPAVHTPLMLQTVLGFDAGQIGRAFVMPAATMAQRLVRAKRRIREARIPFVVPDRGQMPERLTPVLEAIYGAYAIDFPLAAGPERAVRWRPNRFTWRARSPSSFRSTARARPLATPTGARYARCTSPSSPSRQRSARVSPTRRRWDASRGRR